MKLMILIGLLSVCIAAVDPPLPIEGPIHPEGGLPAGYVWKFNDGADFWIYYGAKGKGDLGSAGIYFGTAPSFHPPSSAKTEDGEFAHHKISWRIWTESGII